MTKKLRKAREQLIGRELLYYEAAAKYQLLTEGIDEPSYEQLRKTENYLSHVYVKLSALLAGPGPGPLITDRELEILYRFSCGERRRDIAASFGVSYTRINQLCSSILKKLWASSDIEAVYIATRLGYLPFKKKLHHNKLLKLKL